MATVRGGQVRPHVQAFADAVAKATGAESFGTYAGHQPTIDRALDIFVPTNSRTLGDAICRFAQENVRRFGVDYVIYRQHIWNPEISPSWRLMADRGGPTQNHIDHVHVSFEATAPGSFANDDDLDAEERAWLKQLAADARATNEAVGRLETAVRDETYGLGRQVAAVRAELER